MTLGTRIKRGIVRLALIGVVLSGVSITLSAMPADQPYVGAFKWVRSLEPAKRSYYLQDSVLRSLPVEYRHALVGSLVKEERAAFWQNSLATYRDRHDLKPDQVSALNRAIQHATPDAFGVTERSVTAWNAFEAGLRGAFGEFGTDDLLYISKRVDGGIGLPTRERIAYEWRQFKSGMGLKADEASCDCQHDYHCGTGYACTGTSCTPASGAPCGGAGSQCIKRCTEVPQT